MASLLLGAGDGDVGRRELINLGRRKRGALTQRRGLVYIYVVGVIQWGTKDTAEQGYTTNWNNANEQVAFSHMPTCAASAAGPPPNPPLQPLFFSVYKQEIEREQVKYIRHIGKRVYIVSAKVAGEPFNS